MRLKVYDGFPMKLWFLLDRSWLAWGHGLSRWNTGPALSNSCFAYFCSLTESQQSSIIFSFEYFAPLMIFHRFPLIRFDPVSERRRLMAPSSTILNSDLTQFSCSRSTSATTDRPCTIIYNWCPSMSIRWKGSTGITSTVGKRHFWGTIYTIVVSFSLSSIGLSVWINSMQS